MKKLNLLPQLLVSSALLAGGVRYGYFYLFHIICIIYLIYLLFNFKESVQMVLTRLLDPVILFFILYLTYPLVYFLFTREEVSIVRVICNGFGFVVMLAAIHIISQGKEGLKKLCWGLGGVYTAHLTLSSLEAFHILRWPISSLSRFNHIFNVDFFKENYFDYGTILVSPFSVRPTSFYWSINTAALVTLLGVPFLCLFIKHRVRYLLLAMATMVILASGSRWIIGLLVVTCFTSFLIKILQKQIRETASLLGSMFVGCAFFAFFVMTPWHGERIFLSPDFLGDVFEVVEHGGNGAHGPIKKMKIDESVKSRGEMLYASLELFKEKPLVGIGPGMLANGINGYNMGVPHFYWLEIMVEYGIVFFVLYIITLTLLIVRVFNEKSKINVNNLIIITFILFCLGVMVLGTANYFLPKWVLYASMYILGNKIANEKV